MNTSEIKEHILSCNIKRIGASETPVFVISDRYNGVWMEHLLDAVVWAELSGDTSTAFGQMDLFFDYQKPDGQLPLAVRDKPSYGQTQECVSIGSLCLDLLRLKNDEKTAEKWYSGILRWVEWLKKYRMITERGLCEMFCGYDVGHDNSGRLDGMKYRGRVSDDAKDFPLGCNVAPVLAPDMNAVFYGDIVAAAKLAKMLQRYTEASRLEEYAAEIRTKIIEVCYEKEDDFFYDVDKNGIKRKIKNISITNVLHEGVTDSEQSRRIFMRHLWNENEFKAPYPFPSVSMDEPVWKKPDKENCWGYYSQALTVLRATRWMPRLGLEKELAEVLNLWVKAWEKSRTVKYGQELDPITGEPSSASPWYSSCMLLCLVADKLF